MNLEIDPAKVLYVVGVLFGIAAVAYFARDIVFELSITVRALLLLLGFAVLLVAALAASRNAFVLVFAVLSAAAYLAFVAYTLSRFKVGADGTFLVLFVSAGLFLALGYLVRERDMTPSPRTARYVAVGVLLVAAVLVGADVVASEVTYEVVVEDEAVVDDRGQVIIGAVRVENQFVYREPIDVPRAFACIYVPGMDEYDMRPEPVQYRVDDGRIPDSVPGAGTITATMTVGLSDEEAATVDGPMPIEVAAECPDPGDEPLIVVVTGGDMPRPPRP